MNVLFDSHISWTRLLIRGYFALTFRHLWLVLGGFRLLIDSLELVVGGFRWF